jgi:Sec-independent protein translocase protein TatA
MGDIGVPQLLIILVIEVICFGSSRLAKPGQSHRPPKSGDHPTVSSRE